MFIDALNNVNKSEKFYQKFFSNFSSHLVLICITVEFLKSAKNKIEQII